MKQVTLSSIVISALLAASPAFSASGANANKGRLVAQNTRAVAQVKRADAAPGATTTAPAAATPSTAPAMPQGPPGNYTTTTYTPEQTDAINTCSKLQVTDDQLVVIGNEKLNEKQMTCLITKSEAGLGACGKTYVKAEAALKEFKKVCNEAKYGDLKKCVETAFECAAEDPDATAKETAEDRQLYRDLNLDIDSNKAAVKSNCAKFTRKDYDAQKKEISDRLRDAKKDLESIQKERAKSAEEYSSNKRKQVEKQSRIQEQMSKLVDANQKEAQERAQEMSKGIIETEKEQAGARVQNIKAQGDIAKIQGLRANDLSKLTDAMISTNCMTKMELLLKQWALEGRQSVRGAAALFQSNTEKKRRLQDEHRACMEQLTSTRKQLRKQYAAEVQAVKETIKSNDKQAAALEEQKSRQASDYQSFLARQGASTQEAYVRANAELTAIGQENTEIEAIRNSRSVEAAKYIKEAEERITDLSTAMSNIGAEPRGEKLPGDAIVYAQDFLSTVEAFNDSPNCKPMVPVIEKMLSKNVLSAIRANGATKTSDSSGTTPAKTNRGSQ